MRDKDKCPQCGGVLIVIYGPAGCPACFWVEPKIEAADTSTAYIPTTVRLENLKGTCFDCRYAGTHTRPKIMEETGFDDQLMFADASDDETVYTCKAVSADGVLCVHAGKEIGLTPIFGCAAWAPPKVAAGRLAELDAMIAAREARTAKKAGE